MGAQPTQSPAQLAEFWGPEVYACALPFLSLPTSRPVDPLTSLLPIPRGSGVLALAKNSPVPSPY
jgi:hypothetical protein